MKLAALAGERISADPEITGLTADSRAVEPGFLFAALPGSQLDGAKFIPQAEKNGAAAILARPGATTILPIVYDKEPRRRLAQMAARFYPRQPSCIAGVTGTNGKTSTARFAAQLWSMLGEASGSLGTLGAAARGVVRPLAHTTPEPVTLHQVLDEMASVGTTHLAMEVSSHALAQYRADAVRFSIAAFTNITQDHLDYHADFADYFAAKARLFDDILSKEGAVVVNTDGEGARDIIAIAKRRRLRLLTVGAKGEDIKLRASSPSAEGLQINVAAGGEEFALCLPLIGAFQVENALLAAGIVIASGAPINQTLCLLDKLEGVPGRMQRAATLRLVGGEASVYVDYAHTPDAVASALSAIRPHVQNRLIAIIGAGGDRDKLKRPLMGEAAARGADIVIVTDDNPRTENPSHIRCGVMKGCPDALEIGDRADAIAKAVAMLKAGDLLLVAGKGHETGQQVGSETLPFDDVKVAQTFVRERIQELGRE